MFKKLPKFIKGVVFGGLKMLHTMGITKHCISDELKEIERQAKENKFQLKVVKKTIDILEERIHEDPLVFREEASVHSKE